MATPSDENIIIKRAHKELRYAIAGTGITLVCAVALYLWVPSLRASMKTTDEHVGYERIVSTAGSLGEIQYISLSPEETSERLQKDALILKHRFERGDFLMLTVARATIEKEALAMKKNKASFRYTIENSPKGAVLKIKATSASAKRAMSSYLSLLKKHWKN